MEIYLVGGAVRDELLGLPIIERDWLVVGATPEDLRSKGFTSVGKDFPVFLHPDTKEEYALARTERKTGHGYAGFTFHTAPDVNLEEDLKRRDLTINAIAKDNNNVLHDPYDGKQDLDKKILRHISPSFAEDPLRVLRVARFSAKLHKHGFSIAPETSALMQQISDSGELDYLTPERVWLEWEKALKTSSPSTFISELINCHALNKLWGELEDYLQKSESCSNQYKLFDPLSALDKCSESDNDNTIRFAALLAQAELIFGGDSYSQLVSICEKLRTPNNFQQLAEVSSKLLPLLVEWHKVDAESILGTLESTDYFRRKDRFFDALIACHANLMNSKVEENPIRLILSQLDKVTPANIIAQGIKGKEIGTALRKERLKKITEILNNKTTKQQKPTDN